MRRALACLLLCSSAGCGELDEALDGRLSARSDEYGSWSMSPTTCSSGQHQDFFGVDLRDGDDIDRAVRLVHDPVDGYTLLMNIPDHDLAIVLREPASGCASFDLHVERSNTRVNGIWAVRGHAHVSCRLPGLELDADLEFSGCT